MMNQLIRSFFLLQLFLGTLLANVYLQVPQNFTQGEALYFSLQVVGEKISFPQINKIDGFSVESIGTSRSITNINGNITSKITKRFRMFPTKEIVIPSFSVTVDGKNYTTKSQRVTKEKVTKTDSIYFELNLNSLKKEIYVGESTIVTLQFKHRKDVQIVDLGLTVPTFENFWSKQLDNAKKFEEGNYIVQELEFLLFPQKEGELIIEPLKIDVATLDLDRNSYSFFNRSTQNKRIFSNALTFNVKPLPQDVKLIGEFNLTSSVDKTNLTSGESLSYKIELSGYGNIEDVEDINLEIPNATIYENKPQIETKVMNEKYYGSYKKSFSILAQESFSIPSITIKYFNQTTQKIEELKTKAYPISIKTQEVRKPTTLEKKVERKPVEKTVEVIQVKSSWQDRALFALFGAVGMALMIGLYFYVINKSRKKEISNLPLAKQVKQTKTNEALLKLLLPYIGISTVLDECIFELEKKDNNTFKARRKMILEVITKENIKEI